MGVYVVRRLIQIPVVLVFVVIINFTIIHLAPGDPATVLVGEFGFQRSGGSATNVVDEIRERWGLNRPIPEQLAVYLGNVARGDLGYSYAFGRPVMQLVLDRVPATLLLLGVAEMIAFGLGTGLGALGASRRESPFDRVVLVFSIGSHSVPVFWTGLMVVLIFAVRLHVLPTSGMVTAGMDYEGVDYFWDLVRHMVLPCAALVAYLFPVFLRVTRASMGEVIDEEYVRTARAKGLAERVVFARHMLRNALLPTVTLFGLFLGSALSGAVLVETVFGWPGLGRLLFEAIGLRDYPLMMGILVVSSAFVTIASLFTDLICARLDPRVALQ
jgi:peptide/nickel transport system permease protein